MSDDSGLCVDALNGMPGVLSARWAGRHGDDEGNLRLVLGQLGDVPEERRGAHFACLAALVLPSGREHVSEGAVHGRLIRAPRGANGFGYDPIFVAGPGRAGRGGPGRRAGLALAGLTTGELDPARQGPDQPPRQGAAQPGPGHRRLVLVR